MSKGAVVASSTSEQARVIGAVCAMISVAAPPFLVAVLAVQIEDQLGFSTTELGLGVGGYFLISAVMSPVAVVAVLGAGWVLSVAAVSAFSERLQAAIESASSNAPASVVVLSVMDFIAASVGEVVDGFFDPRPGVFAGGISNAFDGTLTAFVVPPCVGVLPEVAVVVRVPAADTGPVPMPPMLQSDARNCTPQRRNVASRLLHRKCCDRRDA